MKVLYFDLDGTVLSDSLGAPKPALSDGAFERAVRRAQFDSIVCVANAVNIVHFHREHQTGVDVVKMMFDVCGAAFSSQEWFRSNVKMARDPGNRGAEIDLDADWWYVDDLAELYLGRADRRDVFDEYRGTRILVPDPDGNGTDVLRWLSQVVGLSHRGE